MEQEHKEQLDSLLHAIQAKRWSQFEQIWENEVAKEDPPLPFDFHKPIVSKLVHKEKLDHFIEAYQPYLTELAKGEAAQTALEIITHILEERKDVDLEWLRQPLNDSIRLVYGDIPSDRLEDLMEKAGLEDTNQSLNRSLRRFDDLLGARKGQVFLHSAWGVGVVTQLDLLDEKVTIDFIRRRNQVMTLDGVRRFLQRVPNDHLRARIALEPDAVREMIAHDPGEIITIGARGNGGRIKVADLKRLLTTDFLTDAEYKSFWNTARKVIKLNSHIEQHGTGVNAVLVILDSPKTFIDEILKKMAMAVTTAERRALLRDVSRHGDDAGMDASVRDALHGLFNKPLADGTISTDVDKLRHGILFLEYEEVFRGEGGQHPNPVDVRALLSGDNVEELVSGLESHEGRRIALELLLELHPLEECGTLYTDTILSMDSRTAAWMDKRLEKEGADEAEHFRHAALERIFARPDSNPELFVWAAKNVLQGKFKELANDLPSVMICEELLSLLSEITERIEEGDKESADLARNQAARIRAVFSDGNSKLFKKAVEDSTFEEARQILRAIHLHNGLSNQLKSALEATLVNVHGNLRKVSRMEEEEEKRHPSHHYTTQKALDEKRTQLSRWRTEDIPELSKAIESARELGDLRENAEYHAAKDRQKLLMQQCAELEDMIARARVVEPRETTSDVSRFGTKLTLKELSTGEVTNITLMGMWEADPDQQVISYLTPFGSQLLNRRVGQTFSVKTQDGREMEYELLGVESALEGTAGRAN